MTRGRARKMAARRARSAILPLATREGGVMAAHDLQATARALVAEGKGILAADESDGTIKKRFDSIGVESTEENRRAYRDLLFTTDGADEFISGVIMFDETIRQTSEDGTPFPQVLESRGIIPGIKVDKGAKGPAPAPRHEVAQGRVRRRRPPPE